MSKSTYLLRRATALFACTLLGSVVLACAGPTLSERAPPLADFEEPPAWLVEPADETARQALDAGAFSGARVRDARQSLDALVGEPEGLEVVEVVENSPAQAAGLEPGDLLLAVIEPKDEARAFIGGLELGYPSHWRALELGLAPGTPLVLRVDRAGRERTVRLELVPRVVPAARDAATRLREERRVGVVLRSATEFEARNAGLAPGAGAVIVGLAASSPWRSVGLVYGDLVVAVDGVAVAAPAALVDAIRLGPEDGSLPLTVVRGATRFSVDAPLSKRAREMRDVSVPLVFSYERTRERSAWSALLGLVRYESTRAAWKLRLLWFMGFSGGDADRLREVDG